MRIFLAYILVQIKNQLYHICKQDQQALPDQPVLLVLLDQHAQQVLRDQQMRFLKHI
jgi:hypothetical protein